MERAGRLIHVSEALNAGYTGRGITAAVIDTGIGPHPDVNAGRILQFRDFVHRKQLPYDDSGHGTHVCGILAGDGTLMQGKWRGVAPECRLIVIKALNYRGEGDVSEVLAALKWILEQNQQLGIRVLNLSFGAGVSPGNEEYDSMVELVDRLWNQGVCVVTAAGNQGPEKGTITVPGCSRRVITVGAAEAGRIANRYSGRGPTMECVMKPDLVAPAANIVSLMPIPHDGSGKIRPFIPGKIYVPGLFDTMQWTQLFHVRGVQKRLQTVGYAGKSGTSMATPMVAGAVCLLLQKYPELTPKEVKKKLWQSCLDLGLPKEQQGHGLLDLRRLLELY